LVGAILREIEVRHNYLNVNEIKSIYFGGGTPSILSEAEITSILEALAKRYTWTSGIEITLESNPDDISPAALQGWQLAGINRLSIGLQSFNDEELRWMNRLHTSAESVSSVKMAQDAGLNNLSVDLIYGSRFQDMNSWEQTLRKVVDLKTTHISSYNLTIENKTKLGTAFKKGLEPIVSDELSAAQFLMMHDALKIADFEHYEVSNFAKKGQYSRHNSNYWLQGIYLGLGPSAHSYDGRSRQWNVRNNNTYIKALENGSAFFETETLTLKDKYNEYILTRLRTKWGCSKEEIKTSFGEKFLKHFESSINTKSFFLEERDGVYRLNTEGMLRADGISADLFYT
jgi:oxygen-independent coproporphyrinogen III oxidase